MPSCCAGESLDIFGERGARRELRRYLRDGLGGDDAKLIAAWAEEGGLAGARVVEVGGGIGQIQGELVRRGAAAGTVVEVVGAYAEPAAELADAVGIAGRTTFLLADVLQDASGVAPADIVVSGTAVSRSHCLVELGGDKLRVTDLNSTNGTYIDDERVVGSAQLAVGSVLRVGNVLFEHQVCPRSQTGDADMTPFANHLQPDIRRVAKS